MYECKGNWFSFTKIQKSTGTERMTCQLLWLTRFWRRPSLYVYDFTTMYFITA